MSVTDINEFKQSKQYENDYLHKFLPIMQACFGNDKNTHSLLKKLYVTMRYLSGISTAIFALNVLGMAEEDLNQGKQFYIDWLKEIINTLEGK
jgi:hypothetical protein